MSRSDLVVSKPGFLTITHKENPRHIYFQWENFSIALEDCQDAFARAEKAMVERGVFFIVSDIVKVKQQLRPEVAQWWGETCMPSLAKCGVKLIVNLLPASARDPQSAAEQIANGIVMQKAFSMDEAASLVRAFSRRKTS